MLWFDNKNISIFSSLKSDGNMVFEGRANTDLTPADTDTWNEKVRLNRISFFKKHGIDSSRLVNLNRIHSTNIYTFTRESILGSGALDPNSLIPDTDALITNISNSYLMLTGADCFPVFFYDKKRHTAGAAHCGWRGILAGLPLKVIAEFRKAFNSLPSDINIWLGPGIKRCHFEVQKDVVELFKDEYPDEIIRRDAHYFIDLPAIIKRQLVEAGIQFQKITEHPDCAFCEKDKWFSSRRDKPKRIEANAFIIQLKYYDGK